jgi:hypothetical protein
MRATCPVGKHRDGVKAVSDATWACELTKWKHPDALATLAAAYAECGKFDEAARYERKALADPAFKKRAGDHRLKLYLEKKPYRSGWGKPSDVSRLPAPLADGRAP